MHLYNDDIPSRNYITVCPWKPMVGSDKFSFQGSQKRIFQEVNWELQGMVIFLHTRKVI